MVTGARPQVTRGASVFGSGPAQRRRDANANCLDPCRPTRPALLACPAGSAPTPLRHLSLLLRNVN